MLHLLLLQFYERDIQKMIVELKAFRTEADLWQTIGIIRNTAGTLALHIIGGMNFLIGTKLANTGYVRDRDLEFSIRDMPRDQIIRQLEALSRLMRETLKDYSQADMEADYPMMFDGAKQSMAYVLTQLALHLNYHLGQINYLRGALERDEIGS